MQRTVPTLRSMKALALIAVASSGCYLPEPVDPTSLAAGENLRVLLTADGLDRLREITPNDTREVTGRLVDVTPDSLTLTARLSVPLSASRAPASVAGASGDLRQTLSFARADIQQVAISKLHKGRTAAVVGSALVVVGILIAEIFDFGGSTTPGGPGPGPPAPAPNGPP